jgi:hypothetical protein
MAQVQAMAPRVGTALGARSAMATVVGGAFATGAAAGAVVAAPAVGAAGFEAGVVAATLAPGVTSVALGTIGGLAEAPHMAAVAAGLGAGARAAAPVVDDTVRAIEDAIHGPFIHGINKGGLSDIVRDNQLISTTARDVAGAEDAVRAYTYSLDKLTAAETDFVEFFTRQAPTAPNPGQSSVSWSMPAGSRLDVLVTRIAHPNGSITQVAPTPGKVK